MCICLFIIYMGKNFSFDTLTVWRTIEYDKVIILFNFGQAFFQGIFLPFGFHHQNCFHFAKTNIFWALTWRLLLMISCPYTCRELHSFPTRAISSTSQQNVICLPKWKKFLQVKIISNFTVNLLTSSVTTVLYRLLSAKKTVRF